MSRHAIPVADIAGMLRTDADSVARALLPAGRYEERGAEWAVSSNNSPTGEAISVNVSQGPKRGVVGFWNAARQGGDLLDLVEAVFVCSKREAVSWALRHLGIDTSRDALKAKQRASASAAERAHRIEQDRLRRLSVARNVWESSGVLAGAPAAYLAGRGLDLQYADGELRGHHGLPHPDGGTFPAVVARVKSADGRGLGVWRIYVKPDGSGKAPVENPKLGLGSARGGAVRIGGVWPVIGVAEGVETALAAREITGGHIPIWAALSTSGLRGLTLPPEVTHVRIFADNDTVKFRNGGLRPSPGMAAANDLCARLLDQNIEAKVEAPPPGMDWLDVLQLTKKGLAA